MKPIQNPFSVFILSCLFLFGLTNRSGAQCSANFTYNIGANGQVNFMSTSTGTSTSTIYYWTFGPGTFSATGAAGMAPIYTYTANGM